MGMSHSKLRKFCLENFGKPPHGIIDDARMKRADGLLHYGDIPISRIAEQLGFANVFSFSKAFRKYYGTPPRPLPLWN